ncbi:lipase maturation factor 2 isoform X2 [Lingula anatina]|uniref:Lipase maturation factor n=1 Tax=Lingula anatina TaxID=7574 RepID=A0A1S3IGL9_LINAN|nr:lipase maturation factor 2 isoform X2 [Lingula anatina]|eukprot:XP_013397011.1 lipase maturation factor 2 isoform X2 [Lingula anatina]
MAELRRTRDLFLRSMAVIYMFAFSSLYVQIPGLYGDNGILPVRNILQKEPNSFDDFQKQPTLIRLLPKLGLDIQSSMDFIALLGICLSFSVFVSGYMRGMLSFTCLWALYFSLFQVGQTFLWFQWDILLLEAGFLTILLAPAIPWKNETLSPHDHVIFWLLKWLLFRLMFASGVVKLTSECPTWWGLTALNWHYESQCIPTPLAWYFHQLPEWWNKLCVSVVFVILIPVPWFFFFPVRGLRIFAFWCEVFFQILIIITGNYNFFNMLTIVLCMSLLDDQYLTGRKPKYVPIKIPLVGLVWKVAKIVTAAGSLSALLYYSITLFNLKIRPDWTVDSKIEFTLSDLNEFLKKSVPLSIAVGIMSLGFETLKAVLSSLKRPGLKKIVSLVGCVVFGIAAVGMFAVSLVPHTVIEKETRGKIPPGIKAIHSKAMVYRLSSSYGLFRRMTGVGGRPEVIIEGSNSMDYGWKEYEFYYKPGNVSRRLPIVAPHQPRLDWQMWFAALGTYQQNPWLVNLAYRLLTGQPEVLELIQYNPFPDHPPKYIRANLFHYHYTSWDKKKKRYSTKNWWWRQKKNDYLPILSSDEDSLVQYMRQQNIIYKPEKKPPANMFRTFVEYIRNMIGQMEGFTFVVSIFTAAVAVTFLGIFSP